MTGYRNFSALIAFLSLLGCQTPAATGEPPAALAEEDMQSEVTIPDLTGTWSARLRSIYRGVGLGGQGASEGADIDYLRFTIEISVQDGRLFYGTSRSQAQGTEADPPQEVFGAIRSDGKSAIYITSTGRGTIYFISAEEMEVCGGRGSEEVMLAFCSLLQRERVADPGDLPVSE